MENNENKELKFTQASIDADILDIMKQDDFAKSMENSTLFRRYFLNFMAENLSLMHQIEKLTETIVNLVTMVNSKELADYYNKAEENVKEEEKTQKTMGIIKKSHQKSKKSSK